MYPINIAYPPIGIAIIPENHEIICDNTVGQLFWMDADTGRIIRRKSIDSGPLDELGKAYYNTAFAVNVDKKLILAASTSISANPRTSIVILDANTGMEVSSFGLTGWGFGDRPLAGAISDDGKFIALGSYRRSTVIRIANGQNVFSNENHNADDPNTIWSIAFTHDGKWLIRGGTKMDMWNTRTWVKQYQITGDYYSSVAINGNSTRVLAGGMGGLRLIDLSSGRIIREFSLPPTEPRYKWAYYSVGFISGGPLAYGVLWHVANPQGAIAIWDTSSGKLIGISDSTSDTELLRCATYSDGIIYAASGKNIYLYKVGMR